jgi:hypothetical protein
VPLPVTVLASALIGFVVGLAVAEVATLPELSWRGSTAEQNERDAALLELLEAIVASEGIMLAFNDEVVERLDGVTDEAVALAAIASAAADGADGLRDARPGLLDLTGDRTVDDVRERLPPAPRLVDRLPGSGR